MFDKNIFFDCQLHNPKTSWTLVSQKTSADGAPIAGEYDYSNPIIRGIISETEFGVSGAHDFGESELLSGLKSTIGNLLGIANNVSEGLALAKAVERDLGRNIGIEETARKGIDAISNSSAKDLAQKVYDYAGSKFTTALDYVKVFKGTGLEIDFPTLETRIYHKSFNGLPVKSVIKKLIDRFVGPLIRTSIDGLDNILGIQGPPNGYTPDFKIIGGVQNTVTGSFGLNYGPYKVRNLLVTNFSFRLSTFVIREPSSDVTSEEYKLGDVKEVAGTPLYADIRINVQPCTFVSRNTLKDIIGIKMDDDTGGNPNASNSKGSENKKK